MSVGVSAVGIMRIDLGKNPESKFIDGYHASVGR